MVDEKASPRNGTLPVQEELSSLYKEDLRIASDALIGIRKKLSRYSFYSLLRKSLPILETIHFYCQ